MEDPDQSPGLSESSERSPGKGLTWKIFGEEKGDFFFSALPPPEERVQERSHSAFSNPSSGTI
jgi:hypothetical protein